MVSDVQDHARDVMGDTGGAYGQKVRIRPGQNRTRVRDGAWNDHSAAGFGFQRLLTGCVI